MVAVPAERIVSSSPSRVSRLAYRARRTPSLLIGVTVVALYVVVALTAPVLAPRDPLEQDYAQILESPGVGHLLGTDDLGRDTLSRLIYSARLALLVAGCAVILGIALGAPLGLLAGFFRGSSDFVIRLLSDALYAFPTIILALAIVTAMGNGALNVAVAIGIAMSPVFMRLVRAQTLSLRESDFVLAARCAGAINTRIMFRHILPNVAAPVIVQASLGMAFALLAEAGLSFLGVGISPPTATLGGMLQRGFGFMDEHPALAFSPGVAIFVLSLGFNFLGDGLRDFLDPRLRSS